MRGLKNAVFSSKILESYIDSQKHKSHREQVESKAQSPDSSSTILEKESQAQQFSLAKSHYENATLESSIDCRAATSVAARNDRNNTTSKKVDSSTATNLSKPQAAANNDDETTQTQTPSDSKIFESQAQNVFSQNAARRQLKKRENARNRVYENSLQDSRILELESGFFKRAQGRILGVCNRSTRAEIHDSSPKAESSKETKPLICIPTYNEAKNIAPLLREIFSLFPKIHILIIDDNSTDGTQEILASLSRSYPNLHVLKRAGKLGLASAYIDGFLWGLKSGFSHFIQMDADFSHHPRYLAQTLANLPHFEVVINSRNIIGGGVVGWGLSRKILSRFGSLYARLWLGARVMDFTGGFNAYSARALSAIDLHSIKSSGYCFQIEMKYRAYKAGLRLLELPIIFEDRIAGKSKMSKTIVLEALWRTPFLRLQAIKATHKKVCK
ncbi:polyprenol monophosphomannose synthase [Helicobacter canis]|uniref:polyprenol monophosphomannose synthase n=1 Tax=Helicobacter canis TaxID=29419 RepID=UPI001B8644AF|nr:polyprenol monophosphomannose synthase [Helicobacter canis]